MVDSILVSMELVAASIQWRSRWVGTSNAWEDLLWCALPKFDPWTLVSIDPKGYENSSTIRYKAIHFALLQCHFWFSIVHSSSSL